jgi:hypothetical protein
MQNVKEPSQSVNPVINQLSTGEKEKGELETGRKKIEVY